MSDDARQDRIPIVRLWGCYIVPLQGHVTDEQAAHLTSALLDRLRERGGRGVVLDVSGLWMVDSHLCAVLGQIAASARLMGTEVVACGLSPDVALTLQAMGISLDGMRTALGLEQALGLLGVRAVIEDEDDEDEDLLGLGRRPGARRRGPWDPEDLE